MIAKTAASAVFAPIARYLAGRNEGTDPTRVAWTSSRNLVADDPALAADVMQATAGQNPRVDVPVYHLTLSFAPEDSPTRELMEQVADHVLSDLGLAEHQALLVAHQDRQHQHVHLLVNRIHPETFAPWDRWQDHTRLDRVLSDLETTHGLRAVPERFERLADRAVVVEHARDATRDPRADARPLVARLREIIPEIRAAQTWQELRDRLQAHGVELERRAHGLVFADGISHVKASRVAADTSLARLEARLGPYPPVPAADHAVSRPPERSAYEIARAIDSATQRLRQAEWAVERANRSGADTQRALAGVFVDPSAAAATLMRYDAAHGADRAADALREHPEQFGTLLTVERQRAFGLWTSSDEAPARVAAIEAAGLVREWTEHARQARDLLQLQFGASNDAIRSALATLRVSTSALVTQLRNLSVDIAVPLPLISQAIQRTVSDVLIGRERDEPH